ncbi:MAG: histidine--tRNA ligase [Thermosynechococcaceae cyanobacterium]
MAKPDPINYTLPSGFDIELLPGEKRLEQHWLDTIRQVYERYGFTPIETPAVERLELLQAKGNQGDNIIYAISPVLPPQMQVEGDQGKDSRALKFDQTVPLAAYIARNRNNLVFPFARYQMDMVFRGERAKTGRYRQFRQCDIDVVGRGSLSLLYDAQMPAIIAEIFSALHIGDFLIRINNRKVLTGFFAALGVEADQIKGCIKIIDTLEKIGAAKVKAQLQALGVSGENCDRMLTFTQIQGSVEEVLGQLQTTATEMGQPETFTAGISELTEVIQGVRSLQVPESQFCIDLSIARGLDYYTGTVYETTLLGYESLGSICSGGRYEELVGMFAQETMPGVGLSIGLTRLMRKLLDADIIAPLSASPTEVMVVNMQQDLMPVYFEISQQLRQAGIKVLTGFEKKSIGKQLDRADKLGIPLCIIIGSNEAEAQVCRVKVMETGQQLDIPFTQLVAQITELLE